MTTSEQINEEVLARAVERARDRGIVLPSFSQQKDPSTLPAAVATRLQGIGLWDLDPLNLFRITWKNEPKAHGGGFGEGNWLELPSGLTGVETRIIGLVGKWFPTGAHKVGAAYGCLVPRLVTGQFDPTRQKAVWPSTGNYCRGGAYDCALLACPAVAILPEGMSRERFDWLSSIGTDEIIATPGTESNVKEIYDKCWELRDDRGDAIVIFNQFDEFGNAIWHYQMTGSIVEEIFENHYRGGGSRLAGFVSATGSAGTIAAGDYLRTRYPLLRVVATEALQCPTLLSLGFGAHRIEGIGDKHVPWIHNVRNTDVVCAVDDEQVMQLLRLFNEDAGRAYLEAEGVSAEVVARLEQVGLSGLCNVVAAIKTAKHFEMGPRDVIFTPLTDSVELYASRIQEMADRHGPYDRTTAAIHHHRYLLGAGDEHLRELTFADRKALHNFKYFTWVEQQGKDSDELRRLWDPEFWDQLFAQEQVDGWDRRIREFNERTGLSKTL